MSVESLCVAVDEVTEPPEGGSLATVEAGAKIGLGPLRSLTQAGVPVPALARAVARVRHTAVVPVTVASLAIEELQGRFPVQAAARLRALPVEVDGRTVLAAVEPWDLRVVDEALRLLGPDVVLALADDTEALDAIVSDLQVRSVSTVMADLAAAMTDTVVVEAEEADEDEGQVARIVRSLFEAAAARGATDVHLEPGDSHLVARFRLKGDLREEARYPLSAAPGIVNQVKVRAHLDVGQNLRPQDGRFDFAARNKGRFDVRVNCMPTQRGVESVTLRLLDQNRRLMSLHELGYSDYVLGAWEDLYSRPEGMLLVTGPTGSGKSTTLYSTLAALATPERKVCTVEDPVEYRMNGVTQVQVNEKAGRTFPEVLRGFVRANPDVILVGEIRDEETARTAFRAANTGHLVLATVHANSAAAAAGRLVDIGAEAHVVASHLIGVASQRLVRVLCQFCRVPDPGAAEQAARLGEVPDGTKFYGPNPAGCPRCAGEGWVGQQAAAEAMVVTDEISRAITDRATTRDIQNLAVDQGMVPIRADGLDKAVRGVTTVSEVLRRIH